MHPHWYSIPSINVAGEARRAAKTGAKQAAQRTRNGGDVGERTRRCTAIGGWGGVANNRFKIVLKGARVLKKDQKGSKRLLGGAMWAENR